MNRQDRNCSTSPEIVGPIAGATEIAMLMLPITTPRRSIGTRVSTVVISSGIIIAVPDACTIRAGSSSQKPGEIAASSVPVQNSAHGQQVDGASRQSLQQEAGGGDHHRHGQHERRWSATARSAAGDAEIDHQPGQRDTHDRLVQDHDERRDVPRRAGCQQTNRGRDLSLVRSSRCDSRAVGGTARPLHEPALGAVMTRTLIRRGASRGGGLGHDACAGTEITGGRRTLVGSQPHARGDAQPRG